MKLSCLRDGYSLFFNSLVNGYQLFKGICLLSRMQYPFISIFGGSRAEKQNSYAKTAFEVSAQLVEKKIAILTGGGPGIMEAANYGAQSSAEKNGRDNAKLWSVGVGVSGVDKQYRYKNQMFIRVNSFYARKWLLMGYSCGFIVFPGGIGTMDELFELFNYNKHHRVVHHPIILFGSSYWQPVMDWYQKAIDLDIIDPKLKKLFVVTDSVDETCEILINHCKKL